MKKFVILGAVLALASCNSPATNSQSANTTAASTETAATGGPPAAFAQCAACHVVQKGAPHGLGPNLYGVYGTKAGELAGYPFSPAMKASGLVWDDATLDAFLTKPMVKVPGTKMSYPGQPDPAKRAEIIAWLKANT